MKKTLLILAAMAAPFIASAAITIDPAIDFDVSTDFSANFTNNNGTTYAWSGTAGIGGTGGILGVNNAAAPTFQTNVSTQFGTDPQSLSGFFLFDNAGQSAATTSVRAGVGTVNNGADSGEYRGINFQIRNGGLSDNFTARLRVRGATISTGLAEFTLTDDHWYRLDGSFVLAADGTSFTYNFALYDYGISGATLQATLFSLENITVDSSADPFDPTNTRHLAFIGSVDGNGYGFPQIDNLGTAVVPEPKSYALLAGFMALGAILYRRRRAV